MKKAIIFGAGGTGQRVSRLASDSYQIVAYTDNDKTKWGKKLENIVIFSPEEALFEIEYDYILMGTLMGVEEIRQQITEMGVPDYKIKSGYAEFSVNSRIVFLTRYAEEVKRNGINGSVGEAGVFRGEFAKVINKLFPEKECYLFDTFEGFADEDIKMEKKESLIEANYMKNLSEKLVYDKMPYQEKVHIYKGWFPETAINAEIKDTFCFVNLDMDLYKPTYEGIKYFYPKMEWGG